MTDNKARKSLQPSALSLLRFSSVTLTTACGLVPVALYLPQFYARDLQLGLGVVGTIFMVVRLLNGFIDPVIGLLSDHTRSRFGKRKPWIVAGGILFFVGAVFLFLPVAPVGALYLTSWLSCFMLGLTMMMTPFYAWSSELPADYHGRSRVQSYAQSMASLGILLVFLLPGIVEQHHGDGFQKMRWLGFYILAMTVLSLPLALTTFRTTEFPGPAEPLHAPRKVVDRERGGAGARLRLAFRAVFGNRLVWRVMVSDFAVSFGQGVRTVLFMFFVGSVLKLPQWASLLFLVQAGFGILAAPIWLRISYRLGKPMTVIAGEVTQIAINVAILALTPDRFWLLLFLTISQGLAQGSGNLMLRAMVADLADDHLRRTGQSNAGILSSIFNVTVAGGGAVAVGAVFPLIGWLGFHPAAVNSPAALHALQWVFALGPALGHALSAALILGCPRQVAAGAIVGAPDAQPRTPRISFTPNYQPSLTTSTTH